MEALLQDFLVIFLLDMKMLHSFVRFLLFSLEINNENTDLYTNKIMLNRSYFKQLHKFDVFVADNRSDVFLLMVLRCYIKSDFLSTKVRKKLSVSKIEVSGNWTFRILPKNVFMSHGHVLGKSI